MKYRFGLSGKTRINQKQKNRQDNNRPVRYPTLLVTLSSLILSGLLAALYLWQTQVDTRQLAEEKTDSTTRHMTNILSHELSQMQSSADKLAASQAIIDAIQSQNTARLTTLSNTLTGSLPDTRNLRIVPADQQISQETGFAALEMIRRALRGQTASPAAAINKQQWVINVVSAVKTETSTIGTLLITYELKRLSRLLAVTDPTWGEWQLVQTIDGPARTLITFGSSPKQDTLTFEHPLQQAGWLLRFQPSKSLLSPPHAPLPFLLITLLALALLPTTFYLFYHRQNRQLTADYSLLETFIRDMADGRNPQVGGYKVAIFRQLAQIMKESGQRLHSRANQPEPTLPLASAPAPEVYYDPQALETTVTVRKIATEKPSLPYDDIADVSDDPFAAPLFQDNDLLEQDSPENEWHDPQQASLPVSTTTDEVPYIMTDTEQAGTMTSSGSLHTDTVPASIFRAYDIRGVVGKDLTPSTVELLGRAIGTEAQARGETTVIVGMDGRLSSPSLRDQLVAGLAGSGCDVITIGTVPTPVLYYATHTIGARSGVMITGSHNPPEYNGFKIVLGGETLANEAIHTLYQRIINQDLSEGEGQISEREILENYRERILDDIIIERPLKVVMDCGNGVAGVIAPQLFEALGCEIIPLYCDVDGRFPNHHPDPGKPENLKDVIANIAETGADLGLAFDGDGDRVGLVTDKGHIIFPDRLLMLLAKDIVTRNPGCDVIYDVKCTRRLAGLISNYGGRPMMWKTGHSLIKAKMKETGALLAGEMSGHIFLKERWYGFDDGIYSAARLVEILSSLPTSADAVFSSFPDSVNTPEINIQVTDENKFSLIEQFASKGQFDEGNVITIDGVRVEFPWGWGLVRASNTTPVLVLRFEADDNQHLDQIKTLFREQLKAVDHTLPVNF